MKKNFSVNIGYMLINIDEDAYDRLSSYLKLLRDHLNFGNDPEEVMKDIEIRMAELLKERLSEFKNVIIIDDVEYAIQEMGDPEVIEENAPDGEKEKKEEGQEEEKGQRRLFRDPENRIIGGVSAGMAAFFNIDPLWIRLAFIFLTLVGGSGILIYFVLWFIAPEAKSISERLQMRGKKVTASNLKRNIEKEFEQVKENFKVWGKKGKKSAGKAASKVNEKTERGAHFIAEVFWRGWQFFLLIFGISLLVLTIYLSLIFLFAVFTNIWPHITFSPFADTSFTTLLFEFSVSEIWGWLSLIGVIGVIMIPLLRIMMSGVLMVFRIKLKNKIVTRVLLSVWIMSLTVLMASVTLHAIHYSKTDIDSFEQETVNYSSEVFIDLQTDDNFNISMDSEQHGTFIFAKNDTSMRLYKYPKISFMKNDVDTVIRVQAVVKRKGGEGDFMLDEEIFNLDSSNIVLSWRPFFWNENIIWDYSYEIYLPDSCIINLSSNVKEALRSRNQISKIDMVFDYFVLDQRKLRHCDPPVLSE